LRDELSFIVLLAEQGTVLHDSGTVVVRSVASRLTEIAPVCTAKDHVLVENGDAVSEIVLVEDSCELRVNERCTALKSRSAPRIDCTALEFEYRVRRVRALLKMKLPEICAEVGLCPVVGIRAVPSAGVVVVAVDIGTTGFSGNKQSDGRSFIVDCVLSVDASTNEILVWMGRTERHHYASIAELLIDSIDVLNIWPFNPRHAIGVFILSLEGDDRSTVGDLSVGNDPAVC
jgi:hypothetical protein